MNHYRYERYYGYDVKDRKIELIEFKTLRETKNGYWIELYMGKEKFVLKTSRKRYAYPTKQEAFKSFEIRTKHSLKYARRDMKNAEYFLQACESFIIEDSKTEILTLK